MYLLDIDVATPYSKVSYSVIATKFRENMQKVDIINLKFSSDLEGSELVDALIDFIASLVDGALGGKQDIGMAQEEVEKIRRDTLAMNGRGAISFPERSQVEAKAQEARVILGTEVERRANAGDLAAQKLRYRFEGFEGSEFEVGDVIARLLAEAAAILGRTATLTDILAMRQTGQMKITVEDLTNLMISKDYDPRLKMGEQQEFQGPEDKDARRTLENLLSTSWDTPGELLGELALLIANQWGKPPREEIDTGLIADATKVMKGLESRLLTKGIRYPHDRWSHVYEGSTQSNNGSPNTLLSAERQYLEGFRSNPPLADDYIQTANRVLGDVETGLVTQGWAMNFLAKLIQSATDLGITRVDERLAGIRTKVAGLSEFEDDAVKAISHFTINDLEGSELVDGVLEFFASLVAAALADKMDIDDAAIEIGEVQQELSRKGRLQPEEYAQIVRGMQDSNRKLDDEMMRRLSPEARRAMMSKFEDKVAQETISKATELLGKPPKWDDLVSLQRSGELKASGEEWLLLTIMKSILFGPDGNLKLSEFSDKTLRNVSIFKAGTHTDSRGQVKEFTKADLSGLIEAFSQGAPPSVPIKIGHSTDEFNSKVATALGIPKELVTGEGASGKGQVRLGEVTALKMNGSLTADIRVSEAVAKLIDEGFLTGVSSELQFDRKQGDKSHPLVLSGLALLGAQRPSLSDLPSLQQATMLDDGSHADAVYFQDAAFVARDVKGRFISEGSVMAPNDVVTSTDPGEQKVYTVPLNDLTRGRQVFASVSAPSEITAKRTALRVIENFLFSLGGPLGTALGVTAGAVASARMIAGKPVLGGIKGLIRWKFEEAYDETDALELVAINDRLSEFTIMEKIIRQFSPLGSRADLASARGEIRDLLAKINSDELTKAQGMSQIRLVLQDVQGMSPEQASGILKIVDSELKGGGTASRVGGDMSEEFAAHKPEGASNAAWEACLTKARADGMDNPEGHCAQKLSEELEAPMLEEIAKTLNLSEWDKDQILVRIAELVKSGSGAGNFEEQAAKIATLERINRIYHFQEETSKLDKVAGTEKELATKLADLEIKGGEESSTMLLESWQAQQKAASDAKVTSRVLEPNQDEDIAFNEAVIKYQESYPDISYAEALKATMKSNPDLYTERSVTNKEVDKS